MKYLEFKSRVEFHRTSLPPTWFENNFRTTSTWSDVKPMILHKDCPQYLIEPYTNHALWYIRLTAMLNKNCWKTYVLKAIRDPKSTVRAAAYRRLLFNIDESPVSKYDIYEMIQIDERVHNYFNKQEIAEFLLES